MPAVSKAQQKFMGMVHTAQKGDMENPSPEVSKAAASMSDKDAKDFASTSHKGLPDHVKEVLKAKIREIVRNKNISEMNTTGNADGYNTPYAFGKKDNEKVKGKKQADLTGYSVVNEAESTSIPNIKLSSIAPKVKVAGKVGEKEAADISGMEVATDKPVKEKENKVKPDKDIHIASGMEVVKENRWLELKKENIPATHKIGKGISNINKQLAEMERFLNWYGKIKQENGVSNQNYWKRTNHNIYSIKERLIKLEQQIRKISE